MYKIKAILWTGLLLLTAFASGAALCRQPVGDQHVPNAEEVAAPNGSVSLAVPAPKKPDKPDPVKPEDKKGGKTGDLQGVWKVLQADFDGPSWINPGAMREWSIAASKITVRFDGNTRLMTYTLGADAQLNALDVTPAMEGLPVTVRKGIYKLTGDRLSICLEVDAGRERPLDHTLSGRAPGRALITLQRLRRGDRAD